MNIDKSQIKMIVANDIGADIEDRLEGERRAANELSGGAQALKQAAKKVPNDLIAAINNEMEEGKISDGMEAHLVVQLVKKYLTKAGDFLAHLGDIEQQKAIVQGGRVDGMMSTIDMVKKVRDVEADKVKQLIELAKQEEGENLRTPAGLAKAEHGTAAERRLKKVEPKVKKACKARKKVV